MRLQYAILVMTMLSSSYQHEVVRRESGGEKRIVCYYTNWSVYRPGTAKFNPQNINPYLCTHLIYAFGGLDRENGLRPYDKYQDIEQGGYAKFTGLKTYNKALKTMLAIGGWNEGSTRFSPLVADDGRRREFVKNVVKFLRINHFDGLDLDWEYPAYRDGGKPEDKQNYAQLVQELREEFDRESDKTGRPRLLLTMAVPAGIEYIDKGYDIPKLNKYLDFMNILSYDYHSAFEPSVNHHSPLYSLEEEGEYNFDSQLTIDATVKHYLLKGADPGKLVLGIPTYGRSYTLLNEESTDMGSPSDGPGQQGDATREKGYLAYYEICNNVNDGGWTVVQPKQTAMGPYAFKGNQWVGYDDEQIARKKSKYVNERNLGGIMFWSIDNDDFRGKCHSRPYPLIEAAKETLIGRSPPASNKLPTSSRGGKTSAAKLSSKLKNHRIPSTTSSTTTTPVSLTTPDPPTTPDPGSDFVCKDEGFFPHPRDCKKYFWCLDSGPSNLGIVAHQFTCPSGLFFNKAADSCDFARNVICKKKSNDPVTTTTTTTSAPSSSSKTTSLKYPVTTTPKTTTSTTTPEPQEDEEEYYEEEQEDPQAIKQLISLIKKLGGVAELEKQLESNTNGGTDSTTPAISKSLYHRVINKQTSRLPNLQRNGPTGPQNEGIARERSNFRKDKPSYVTIRRERPTTDKSTVAIEYEDEDEEIEEDQEPKERPQYVPIQRNRGSQTEGIQEVSKSTERAKLKYQSIDRFRTRTKDNEKPADETSERNAEEGSSSFVVNDLRPATSTLRYTNILRNRITDSSTSTTSRYVTLRRQRPQQSEVEDSDPTEVELDEDAIVDDDEGETVTTTSTTTTSRPRVKIQNRGRRPFTRRPAVKPTTSIAITTTPEPTTQRQPTTVQILKRRLNRFKYDRGLQSREPVSSTESIIPESIEDDAPTTVKTRKGEFRRVIRPVQKASSQLLDSSIEQSIAKDTVSKTKQFHRETLFKPQGQSIATEAPLKITPSAEYLSSIQEYDESNLDTLEDRKTSRIDDETIPDLANVAVAAIQSLATSVPTHPTEQYSTTNKFRSTTELPRLRPSRPRLTTPPTASASSAAAPQQLRPISRSSPRPFSKTVHRPLTQTQQRPLDNHPIDDYDDYYAEPVDVPLSGKVRIHNDGYIECLDIGNFPHPFSCRKFISCAKMEIGHLLGWEYTCPKGLSFDPIGGICNWNAGLGCKD